MQQGRQLILGAFLILAGILLADTSFAAVIVSKPTRPTHVTELKQVGDSKCDVGTSTWSFEVSWKPIKINNNPWLIYAFWGLAGAIHSYECTPELCTGKMSGIHKRQKTAYAWVEAKYGRDTSPMKISNIPYVPNCK